MGIAEGAALVVACLILVETVVLLVAPESLLEFSRWMADRREAMMVFYLLVGLGLLHFFLQSYSLVEIVGVGTVLVIFYGVTLFPFYDEIIGVFEKAHEEGTLWRRFGPGLVLWVLLAAAVLADWSLNVF